MRLYTAKAEHVSAICRMKDVAECGRVYIFINNQAYMNKYMCVYICTHIHVHNDDYEDDDLR